MASSNAEARRKAFNDVQAMLNFYKRNVIAKSKDGVYFDRDLVENLKLIDAGPEGTTEFELLLDHKFQNPNGVMHGGAAGQIFDACTSMAIGPIAKPGFWSGLGGVSRVLNVAFLRAIPVGTVVRIRSRVVQAGKVMIMLQGEIGSVDGKIIYCTCEHHKVYVASKPNL